ncbi:uncharacterized protein LOC131155637 [Malania oleifera]|uniref:uncharacterized protein LOC131155637 n=1 Tax=Malania oleifera TaxID=397392 RepID=UPI0025ADEA58|nr:uncharacterized protein LOC131155637 [Malania oleifera]
MLMKGWITNAFNLSIQMSMVSHKFQRLQNLMVRSQVLEMDQSLAAALLQLHQLRRLPLLACPPRCLLVAPPQLQCLNRLLQPMLLLHSCPRFHLHRKLRRKRSPVVTKLLTKINQWRNFCYTLGSIYHDISPHDRVVQPVG